MLPNHLANGSADDRNLLASIYAAIFGLTGGLTIGASNAAALSSSSSSASSSSSSTGGGSVSRGGAGDDIRP
jgi:hypothetical protein